MVDTLETLHRIGAGWLRGQQIVLAGVRCVALDALGTMCHFRGFYLSSQFTTLCSLQVFYYVFQRLFLYDCNTLYV